MSLNSQSIGIFGGSFNPVHQGHLQLAEKIQELCQFSKLYIVPSHNPPHKDPYEIEDQHRLEMVKLAFSHIPNAEVSTYELESDGPSYAIRTIEYFSRKHQGSPLYFILGADAFNDLPHWYAFPDVMEACNYIVIGRNGWDEQPTHADQSKISRRIEKLKKAGLLNNDASPVAPFERSFQMRTGNKLCITELHLPEISSTQVRLMHQMGQPLNNLVPQSVESYLNSNPVYGSKAPAN